MFDAASFPPADRRRWDIGVLLVLLWAAFHLLGCAHSHGPAFGTHHDPMTAMAADATPAAAPGTQDRTSTTALSPDPSPYCPEPDHAAEWIRVDAPPPPAPGGALPAEPTWVREDAERSARAWEKLAERKAVPVPSKDPEAVDEGMAWPDLLDRERDPLLRPAEIDLRPSAGVLAAAWRQAEADAPEAGG